MKSNSNLKEEEAIKKIKENKFKDWTEKAKEWAKLYDSYGYRGDNDIHWKELAKKMGMSSYAGIAEWLTLIKFSKNWAHLDLLNIKKFPSFWKARDCYRRHLVNLEDERREEAGLIPKRPSATIDLTTGEVKIERSEEKPRFDPETGC